MKARYSFPRYRGTLAYPEAKERAIEDGLNPDSVKCLNWYISGETVKIELTDDEEFISRYLYIPGHGLIVKNGLGEWAVRRNIIIEDDGSLTWPNQEEELRRWKEKNDHAVELGRLGGLSRSNGRKGGRPKGSRKKKNLDLAGLVGILSPK